LKNTDIRDCIKNFEIYKIAQLKKQSFTPLWTFIDNQKNKFENYSSQKRPILFQSSSFKLGFRLGTPTIKELFPDEQLITTNEVYKKELDKVLQRAEKLKFLIKGNKEMQMAHSRLQLVESNLKEQYQQIIKEKQETQNQQRKMKAEIAKQINAIACFSEAFKTHVCMTTAEDGQRMVDQQQLKLFEQSFQVSDEINDGGNNEKFSKNN
jgi:hypothetical protein